MRRDYLVLVSLAACSSSNVPEFAWTRVDHPVTSTLRSVAVYRNGKAIAVGDNGVVLFSDSDGASWQRAIVDPEITTNLLAVGADRFGASPALAGGEHGYLMRSSDFGIFWRPIDSPTTDDIAAIDVTPSAQMVLTRGGVMFVSRDFGDHWYAELAVNGELVAVDLCPDKIVVLDDSDTVNVLDDDGWRPKPVPTNKKLNAIRCMGLDDTLVVIGDHGTIMAAETPNATFKAQPGVTDGTLSAMTQDRGIIVGERGRAFDFAAIDIDQLDQAAIAPVTTDDLLSAWADYSRVPIKVFAVGSAGVVLTGQFRQ